MFPYLTEEHDIIRKAVRDFAEREIKPLAAALDEKEEFSVELTQKMGELGLFGMFLPAKYGGHDTGYLAYIIAVEEIARIDGSHAATLAAHNSLGIGPIYQFGSEQQKMKYLPGLCTGKEVWAFGLTEAEAGSDSRGSKTYAKDIGKSWEINGSKIFITNGSTSICSGVTVQAVTAINGNEKEFSTFIVEKGTLGWTSKAMHGKMMWRASDTSKCFSILVASLRKICWAKEEWDRGSCFKLWIRGDYRLQPWDWVWLRELTKWLCSMQKKENNLVNQFQNFKALLLNWPIWLLKLNWPETCFTKLAG